MSLNLPIWRDSARLGVLIEEAVRGFPRYYKYTLGSDLRRQAMTVRRLLVRALNAAGAERPRQFEAIAALAVEVGRQSGHWRRRLNGRDGRSPGR